jgi:hypothetical protein
MHGRKPKLLRGLGITLAALIFLEIGLRLPVGKRPLLDLEMSWVQRWELSDRVNHLNRPLTADGKPEFPTFYLPPIITPPLYQPPRAASDVNTVVFMGDSFMQGLSPQVSIPYFVGEEWSQRNPAFPPMRIVNAGCSSYAPATFIPQAKWILPDLQPRLIVIDIDETDFGDDYIRYRRLIVRDANGRIESVKHTPLHEAYVLAAEKVRRQPSYVVRLFESWYLTRWYLPKLANEYRRRDPRYVLEFQPDRSPEVRTKYAAEVAFFTQDLNELFSTLIGLVGDPNRVVVVFHPHLARLQHRWNTLVPDLVKEATQRHHVHYFDATETLARAFGTHPEDFYLASDMHFSAEGLREYGKSIAQFIANHPALVDQLDHPLLLSKSSTARGTDLAEALLRN